MAGGGGEKLLTNLDYRLATGAPPQAGQTFLGPYIQKLSEGGQLLDLTPIAEQDGWSGILPAYLDKGLRVNGRYSAVPMNIHSVNRIWFNHDVLEKAGITVPKTWNEFFTAVEKLEKTGVLPVALSREQFQPALIFECLVLGVGGRDFFERLFMQMDPKALNSKTLLECFEKLGRLRRYYDDKARRRSWDQAAEMVFDGSAGMLIMGDWVKGEMVHRGLDFSGDMGCSTSPGADGLVITDTDVFIMFDAFGPEVAKNQLKLARILMQASVQREFNLLKGSAPARFDVNDDEFNQCGQNIHQIIKLQRAVPSFTFYQAVPPSITMIMKELIQNFFRSDMSPEEAARKLANIALLAE